MIHPTDSQPAWPRQQAAVAGGPVTCAACGCRLQVDSAGDPGAWKHFGSLGGRDARGCTVSCVGLPHDATGRVFVSAPA